MNEHAARLDVVLTDDGVVQIRIYLGAAVEAVEIDMSRVTARALIAKLQAALETH